MKLVTWFKGLRPRMQVAWIAFLFLVGTSVLGIVDTRYLTASADEEKARSLIAASIFIPLAFAILAYAWYTTRKRKNS